MSAPIDPEVEMKALREMSVLESNWWFHPDSIAWAIATIEQLQAEYEYLENPWAKAIQKAITAEVAQQRKNYHQANLEQRARILELTQENERLKADQDDWGTCPDCGCCRYTPQQAEGEK